MQPGILEILSNINCQETFRATRIEREIVAALGGSCLSPISALGTIANQKLYLQVRVSNQDGSNTIEKECVFSIVDEERAFKKFKGELVKSGAKELIQS